MMKCPSKRGGKVIDLIGLRYGNLTVIEYAGIKRHLAHWKCLCDCGNVTVVSSNNLRSGTTKSCGCLKSQKAEHTLVKDNKRLYGVWAAMKRRCYNSNNSKYPAYGGRGIKVCDEWQRFEPFYKWSIANGYDENADFGKCTLDRINVNGDYCPSNCRWVTAKEQGNNTRVNRIITIDGVSRTYTQWEDAMGFPHKTISQRVRRGWTDTDAVLTTLRKSGGDCPS